MEVKVEQLTKTYKGVRVLDKVNLTAPSSQITVILGPSGSGKSTLLRLIAGLEEPDSGFLRFDGASSIERARGSRVGLVFQSLALFPNMNVREQLAFPLDGKLRKPEIASRVNELVRLVRLDGLLDRRPEELSGGQQQRLALARALAPDPPLLLLDEPFSNLDPRLREEMRWELKRIQSETGKTMIHVTHDHFEAFSIADHLAILRNGKVEQEGPPDIVYAKPASSWVAWFLGYNVIPYGNRFACFRPADAELSTGHALEIKGKVSAVRRTPTGNIVRVTSEGWDVDVESQTPLQLGSEVTLSVKKFLILDN
ncbi:MAG: ABC transporter ATP-binding protein [Thermoprotei archaeon]